MPHKTDEKEEKNSHKNKKISRKMFSFFLENPHSSVKETKEKFVTAAVRIHKKKIRCANVNECECEI